MPLDDLDLVEDAGSGLFRAIAWIFKAFWRIIAWFAVDIIWALLEWPFDRKRKRKEK